MASRQNFSILYFGANGVPTPIFEGLYASQFEIYSHSDLEKASAHCREHDHRFILIDCHDLQLDPLELVHELSKNSLPHRPEIFLLGNDFSSIEGEQIFPDHLEICLPSWPLLNQKLKRALQLEKRARAFDKQVDAIAKMQQRFAREKERHLQTESLLGEKEKTLRRIFHSVEATSEAILIMEKNERVYYVNPAFCSFTGYSEAEMIGKASDPFIRFEGTMISLEAIKEEARYVGSWAGDVSMVRKDGTTCEAFLDLSLVKSPKGSFEGHILILRDISQTKKMMKKLRELARVDDLTGLYNRRYFLERFQSELLRAQRYGHDTCLLMLDLDHFKKVNDTYGHPAGDLVLKETGSLIRTMIRAMDLAGRYGGEELCIALPETDMQGATIFAERLRTALAERSFSVEGREPFQVTCSIGVSLIDENYSDVNIHVDAVDKALYRAKDLGRNRVESLMCPDKAFR